MAHRFIACRPSATVTGNIINLVREATQASIASIENRIDAAVTWIILARRYEDASQLEATKEILNLLDLAVAESASLESLSNRLSKRASFKNVHGMGSYAAALAIKSGDCVLAVSLLEQGRSSIFRDLAAIVLQLKTSAKPRQIWPRALLGSAPS